MQSETVLQQIGNLASNVKSKLLQQDQVCCANRTELFFVQHPCNILRPQPALVSGSALEHSSMPAFHSLLFSNATNAIM